MKELSGRISAASLLEKEVALNAPYKGYDRLVVRDIHVSEGPTKVELVSHDGVVKLTLDFKNFLRFVLK